MSSQVAPSPDFRILGGMPVFSQRYAWLGPAVAVLLLTACPLGDSQTGAATSSNHEVHMEMKNVSYHYTDSIAVHVQQMEGVLTPTQPGHTPVFDDTSSFAISISAAQIAIRVDSMAHVLNDYILARKDAPIRQISIEAKGNSLLVKGKKGALPFEATVTLKLTPEGEILLHTEKVKVAHLSVKGLMDFLGLEMADLINTKKVHGIRAAGEDLILNTERVLPPPHIHARISSVSIQGNEIVETIGTPQKSAPRMAGNYMAYQGGSIGFGKLTMAGTDLMLIDMDAKDPFDFYLNRYKEQLTAGYSKTTSNFGLRVYMRDFNKLPNARREIAGK